jgi:hypothetical protein
LIASKDRDFCKIPLKDIGPVKYYLDIAPSPRSSVPSWSVQTPTFVKMSVSTMPVSAGGPLGNGERQPWHGAHWRATLPAAELIDVSHH